VCTTLPVLVNSIGGQLESQADVSNLLEVAAYMEPFCGYPACGAAGDGRHTRLGSWLWGDWSPSAAGLPLPFPFNHALLPSEEGEHASCGLWRGAEQPAEGVR
jgi:hypothetical protein